MKFIVALFLLFCQIGYVYAQELPQASPYSTLEQRIGLTDVSIKYSRPAARGRKIWGELVPYGQVWRTGANSSTKISFSDKVIIGNQNIPAGEYSLFTLPSENGEWTVILNKNTKLWGADGYKQEEDLARFTVKPNFNGPSIENMTFMFDNIDNTAADLHLMWDKLILTFRINTNTEEKAFSNITKAIEEINNSYRIYNASANYLLDAKKDPQKALEWARASVNAQEKFWNLYTLSRAYAANNLMKEAIATAEKSLKLSQDSKNDFYIKANQKNLEDWKKKK